MKSFQCRTFSLFTATAGRNAMTVTKKPSSSLWGHRTQLLLIHWGANAGPGPFEPHCGKCGSESGSPHVFSWRQDAARADWGSTSRETVPRAEEKEKESLFGGDSTTGMPEPWHPSCLSKAWPSLPFSGAHDACHSSGSISPGRLPRSDPPQSRGVPEGGCGHPEAQPGVAPPSRGGRCRAGRRGRGEASSWTKHTGAESQTLLEHFISELQVIE